MDGMLSQDEINALLNGMDIDNAGTSGSDAADDMTSVGASDSASGNGGGSNEPDQSLLSDIEKDAIGEIANISMGTSATTLFSLVNQKVSITTPMVTIANWDTVLEEYPAPCVFIEIQYTEGLAGSNILILAERDVKIITDLMMGGDGTNIDGELGELHLSAISEAMNQMMGSSATSLSSMMGKKIDISPPKASLVKINEIIGEGKSNNPFEEDTFVKIAFRMQIGELVDSTIMQLYPLKFAKSLYEIFMGSQMDGSDSVEAAEAAAPAPAPIPMPAAMPSPSPAPDPYAGYGAPAGAPMMPPPQQYAMPTMPQMNVQQAQFQAFTPDMAAIIGKENIGLIMDVPLEVTVELGRTQKSIHDILEFSPGTIIELEKIAGEPIDVLVNGKFVAKGEVVVIEESFGVRITEIIKDN